MRHRSGWYKRPIAPKEFSDYLNRAYNGNDRCDAVNGRIMGQSATLLLKERGFFWYIGCMELASGFHHRLIQFAAAMVALAVLFVPESRADRFTYLDEESQTMEVEARLLGSGQGAHALELADGQLLLIPQAALLKRELADGPEPIDTKAMAASLTEKFGPDLVRIQIERPFVVALILSEPLPSSSESHARAFLKKVATFLKRVERKFVAYAKSVRFNPQPPRFPMPVLIFETDTDFEAYASEATGNRGLSSGRLAGFYHSITNYLSLRMSECDNFETPLHEAIHQQVYNREVYPRMAPVPVWFNEGIATGFEGDGAHITISPTKVNPRYKNRALNAKTVQWSTIVADDKAFRGDVFAGEAYGHAWGMHWLLVTKYKVKYLQYVKMLAQKEPLTVDLADQRVAEFEHVFGKSAAELQAEFRRRVQPLGDPGPRKPPGELVVNSNLGEVKMHAVAHTNLGGALEVGGTLRNVSMLRSMSYHVTVETESGTYADWYVPNVGTGRTVRLNQKYVRKVMPNAPGGPSRTFSVNIRSASPGSEDARLWKDGDLPVPVFGDG